MLFITRLDMVENSFKIIFAKIFKDRSRQANGQNVGKAVEAIDYKNSNSTKIILLDSSIDARRPGLRLGYYPQNAC